MATSLLNTSSSLTNEQITQYHRAGYLIIRQLFSATEAARLHAVALADRSMEANAFGTVDKAGQQTRLTLWYTPGDDAYGLVSRSRRIVARVAQLLDSDAPVCHYHSKLMLKEPRVGGAWEWHQDYGYWYKNQFMFPDQLLSVLVGITEATRANGCIQVIEGSHKLGRVNHAFAGEQVGADQTFVDNALRTMPLVYAELQPGDALFFHANLLHRSEANGSDWARWSLISCYCSQSNLAYNEQSEAYRTPVATVDDDALLALDEAALLAHSADDRRDFLQKANDRALQETRWEKQP